MSEQAEDDGSTSGLVGANVRAIRERFNWSGQQLASLLDVHASTVHRWEQQADEAIKIDPSHCRVILVIQRRLDEPEAAGFVARVSRALDEGGGLKGLWAVLDDLYGKK